MKNKRRDMQTRAKIQIGIATAFFLTLAFVTQVKAQSKVESENYVIQFPNFNSGAGIPSSGSYKVNTTIGQTAPGLLSSTTYRVRSGFQYIHTIIPFSFEVSNISIDFGTLKVDDATQTRTATLTVKAGGAGGYSVQALEDGPMRTWNGAETIIDTLCDSGPCSESSAQPWTLDTTYGFGFNMTGDDIPSDFSGDKYRQFADNFIPESPGTIMSRTEVTWDYPNNIWPWESEATITFKANIGATQAAGSYRNYVTFIAIPAF